MTAEGPPSVQCARLPVMCDHRPYIVASIGILALTGCGGRSELDDLTETIVPEVVHCPVVDDPCFAAYAQASQAAQQCFGWATLSKELLACDDCGLAPDNSSGDCVWPDGARLYGVFVPELDHSQVRLVSPNGEFCAQFDVSTWESWRQPLPRSLGTRRGTFDARQFFVSIDDKGTTIACDNGAEVLIPLVNEFACNIPHFSYCCKYTTNAC